jgi:hypothetical protein
MKNKLKALFHWTQILRMIFSILGFGLFYIGVGVILLDIVSLVIGFYLAYNYYIAYEHNIKYLKRKQIKE